MPLFQKSPIYQATEDEKNKALVISRQLNKIILESLDYEDVVQRIADAIPNELSFATGVVAIIDQHKRTIRRVAASKTKEAIEAIRTIESSMISIPFKSIEISLDDPNNLMAKAIQEHKILITNDSYDVLGPVLNRNQAKIIQDIMGAKTTFVCPIYASKNRPIGIFIASTNKIYSDLTQYEKDIIQIFTDGVGIAVEHALLYSRLKLTSQQLAHANDRLKELDKLKDDFVSVASHELRTPMTAIKSYLWVALNKLSLQSSSSPAGLKKQDQLSPEDLKRYLSRAYISVERLINLVNDMLNISRIESGRIALKLSEVNLNELVNEVTEEVSVKAGEKGIRVIGLNKQIPKVLCDRDKIHEVFLNLIGNSLKFTKAGGTITVDFYEKYPYVFTSVRDTGVGIAPENLSRLFAKFGRLENSYVAVAESGGTGLGLYISKSIINLHKGQINAQSPGLGQGTTFLFSLPIIGTDIAQKLKEEAPKETEQSKDLEKTSVNFV